MLSAEYSTRVVRFRPRGHTAQSGNIDTELVERCLANDETAWEELLRLHSGRVYGLCYRFTGRHSEAQELTQDVFFRVFRTLGTFRRAEASFTTWLIRLTRNLLVDHYRRTTIERSTRSIDEKADSGVQFVAAADGPEEALAQRETRDLVQSVLAMLAPELREPIIFRDLEEMNYRQIARLAGIPEGTVKSRLNRGRAEFTRLLRKRCVAA